MTERYYFLLCEFRIRLIRLSHETIVDSDVASKFRKRLQIFLLYLIKECLRSVMCTAEF
jgi:hypothetical protein